LRDGMWVHGEMLGVGAGGGGCVAGERVADFGQAAGSDV